MMARGPGRGQRRGGGFGGPHGMMGGGPPQKAKNLGRALRQLLGRLRPDRWWIAAAAAIGSVGVGFTVAAPRIIGNATNVLFDGLIGKSLPAGTSQAQAEAYLRLHGQGQLAQMLTGTTVTPGQGIQFNQLGVDLGVVAVLFLLGAVLSWGQGYIMAGVAQRTVSGMRRDVEGKLARLPLQYFDSHPHGDVLSRVTNDIDNVTTTLQQGLSQLLTSILTILGVLVMMLSISPAAGADLAGDGADVDRGDLPGRAPVAEALHHPVGAHRRGQQPGRADPHRAHPGPGLRALPADAGRLRA